MKEEKPLVKGQRVYPKTNSKLFYNSEWVYDSAIVLSDPGQELEFESDTQDMTWKNIKAEDVTTLHPLDRYNDLFKAYIDATDPNNNPTSEQIEYLESMASYFKRLAGHLDVVEDRHGAEYIEGGIEDINNRIKKIKE